MIKFKRKNGRQNGFQYPFHPLQLFSWAAYILELFLFFLIDLPLLPNPDSQMGVAIAFGALFIGGLYYTVKATLCDPTDRTVYLERNCIQRGILFETSLGQVCTVCSTHVKERTKHCGQCNRCVDRFDHHCKWLNNCIGSENYGFFIKMILFILLITSLKLVVSIVSVVEAKFDDEIVVLNSVFC